MAMHEHSQLLALCDQHQRIDLEIHGVQKEKTPHAVRFIRPAPGMNFVAYARLEDVNADAVIQEQVDYFMQYDQPFTWHLMHHDRPDDLARRLLVHGFYADDDTQRAHAFRCAGLPSRLAMHGELRNSPNNRA